MPTGSGEVAYRRDVFDLISDPDVREQMRAEMREFIQAVFKECPADVGFGPLPNRPGQTIFDGTGRFAFMPFESGESREWQFGRFK